MKRQILECVERIFLAPQRLIVEAIRRAGLQLVEIVLLQGRREIIDRLHLDEVGAAEYGADERRSGKDHGRDANHDICPGRLSRTTV